MTTTTNTPTTQSIDLNVSLRQTLSLIKEFGALIEKETHALKEADFKTVDALQNDKRSYADQYQTQVVSLQKHRDKLDRVDLHLREEFILERTQFTQKLTDNMTALENTKDSAQRLANKIISSARDAVQDQPNYAASGYKTEKSSPVSISLDQTL